MSLHLQPNTKNIDAKLRALRAAGCVVLHRGSYPNHHFEVVPAKRQEAKPCH